VSAPAGFGTVAPLGAGELERALRIPPAEPGMRIGLFGGSFNPPHAGHRLVSETALTRAALDRVWWIVTPGNPLKDASRLAPLALRLAACRRVAGNPRVDVTAFEARWRVRYSADTLSILLRHRPRAHFVWIMGADNLASFHRWQNWRGIATMVPILVVDRPGATLSLRSAHASVALSRWRVDEADAELLASMRPPAWTFLHGPRSPLSSTAIRSGDPAPDR
jgi:nicotinate-nucleotide adenylyltransferase